METTTKQTTAQQEVQILQAVQELVTEICIESLLLDLDVIFFTALQSELLNDAEVRTKAYYTYNSTKELYQRIRTALA